MFFSQINFHAALGSPVSYMSLAFSELHNTVLIIIIIIIIISGGGGGGGGGGGSTLLTKATESHETRHAVSSAIDSAIHKFGMPQAQTDNGNHRGSAAEVEGSLSLPETLSVHRNGSLVSVCRLQLMWV
jgi:hypothetical protein